MATSLRYLIFWKIIEKSICLGTLQKYFVETYCEDFIFLNVVDGRMEYDWVTLQCVR